MKERLKLLSHNRDRVVCILFLLILLSILADLMSEDRRSKKNLIRLFSSSSGKIILTLLTKVVAFHMRFLAVHIWGASF